MPRPEHPHIPEVKRWIAANPTVSGREAHEWAVAEWGVDAAPALRTIANALRETLREKQASQPVSVETESLTAGECPECLGYGHFWRGVFWMHGDGQVAYPRQRITPPMGTKGDLLTDPKPVTMKMTCERCVGTGYIGTPATRTPVWEEPEEEALATAPDDECLCKGCLVYGECSVEEAEADPPEVAVPTSTDSIVDQLIEDAANDPTAIVSDDVAERVNPAPPEIAVDMDLSGMNLPDMPKFVTSNEVEL